MTKKKRQTVWNKKTGKFIPASLLKPRHNVESAEENDASRKDRKAQRLKAFSKGLSVQIKRAVKNEGKVCGKRDREAEKKGFLCTLTPRDPGKARQNL